MDFLGSNANLQNILNAPKQNKINIKEIKNREALRVQRFTGVHSYFNCLNYFINYTSRNRRAYTAIFRDLQARVPGVLNLA